MNEAFFTRNRQGTFVFAHHYTSHEEARVSARELGWALGTHVRVIWLVGRQTKAKTFDPLNNERRKLSVS